ncbi:MAG: ROK family protein [Acidimicrobiales bacterium]
MTNGSGGTVTLGLDIGGTKTHCVAFDRELKPIAETRVPTSPAGVDRLADLVTETVAGVQHRLSGQSINAIGIGIPGLVDRHRGTVRQAVNLGIGNEALDLAGRVAAQFGVRCEIDNDVNVGALGAFRVLQGDRSIDDLAYISVGTGIAAGLILAGRIHRGQRGVAGEIGHFPVVPDGPRCECGLRGCLEAIASGSAIARMYPTDGGSPIRSLLDDAATGDRSANERLDRIGDHLALAVYLVAVSYDVDLMVLGGGVFEAGSEIVELVGTGLRRLEKQSGFVRSLDLPGRIMLKPSEAVGALGAALLTRSGASS